MIVLAGLAVIIESTSLITASFIFMPFNSSSFCCRSDGGGGVVASLVR